jgi:DNA invertase Pin-like site-specific DNA recombinase
VNAKSNDVLRLLAYARVSDVRGREGPGFISESEQFKRCRSYADAYGHKIIEEGSDLDVSGGVMTRPTFDRFLELIENGKADGVIVAKLDRFARSNVGALAAVERIEAAGGTLISVSEQIASSSAAGRFLRTILFAAAEWERERIGEQWFTSRSSAVERGIHVSRHVPPGYKRGPKTNDENDRRLFPDPKHAETVQEAFRMAARGETNTTIAAYLTDRKLNGAHWSSFRVPRLLANRVYVGEARSGKGIVNPNAHEPLVDEETFLLAQRERPEGLRRPTNGVSLLSGLVRCAGCSFAMKPQGASATSAAVYRCTKHSTHGTCPEPATVTKKKIEDYLIERFLVEFPNLAFTPAPEDAMDDGLEEAIAAERAYRAQLDNLELRATIGDADHDRLIASLHRDWQEKLAAVRPIVRNLEAPPDGVALEELVGDLRAEGQLADLRELLGSAISAVFVRRAASRRNDLPISGRVKIVWHGESLVELPRRGHRFEPQRVEW